MRLPAKSAIVLCLLLLNIALQYRAQAQKLSSKEHDKKLEGLSEREKVDYIITNHYALYSADYDHALQLNREAGVISKRNKWKDKEAYAEMFQGVIYFLKGDF